MQLFGQINWVYSLIWHRTFKVTHFFIPKTVKKGSWIISINWDLFRVFKLDPNVLKLEKKKNNKNNGKRKIVNFIQNLKFIRQHWQDEDTSRAEYIVSWPSRDSQKMNKNLSQTVGTTAWFKVYEKVNF